MLVRSTCLLAFLAHQAAGGGADVNRNLAVDKKTKEGGVFNINPHIIEGTEAAIGQYPYYVHMQVNVGFSRYSCGGSLIAPRVILSAAHCNDPFLETNVEKGYVGATRYWSTDNGAVLGECEEWLNHPDFVTIETDFFGNIRPGTSVLGGNDFALCLLKEPVDIDTSSVMLTLNDDPFFPPDLLSTVVESMGMGRTAGDRSEGTDVLLRADLSILPQDTCDGIYQEVDDTMICTFDNMDDTMSGVCSGDSGGPIVISSVENGKTVHKQVGVVSWGSGLCGTNPDVYARMSAGMPWIRSTVCDEWGLRDSEFCVRFTCPNGQTVFTVTITTDDTPEQNEWTLLDESGMEVASESLELPNTDYHTELCLQPGDYSWTLTDSGGDGMPYGSVVTSVNNEVIADGFPFGAATDFTFTAPDDLTDNPTSAPTPERSSAPTMAPTEFECDTDQVLTVTVETDSYANENNWVLEKYESDVWTVVASNDLISSNTLYTNDICLDQGGVYRYSIFDSFGDGLCYLGTCGYFEVALNGNVIAEDDSFGSEDVTVFNTCVDAQGTFSVDNRGAQTVATCDELVTFVSGRNGIGGKACRMNNLDGQGRVRDFCASTCASYGEGACVAP